MNAWAARIADLDMAEENIYSAAVVIWLGNPSIMINRLSKGIDKENVAAIWQIVMLILCVYVLGALFVDTIVTLPAETSSLLTYIDNLICLVFIGDFVFNVIRSKNRLGYLKWGWIDLLSSIPNISLLRWGRLIRIIRILRILRGIRSTRHIAKVIFANRAKGTLASVSMISFLLIVSSSIAILNCETAPDSNIKTASDAIWWSFVTITTVGYGDFYPVTLTGRIIAAILMVAGVGMLGAFTAYVALFFIQNPRENQAEEILNELKTISRRLEALENGKKIDQEQQHDVFKK